MFLRRKNSWLNRNDFVLSGERLYAMSCRRSKNRNWSKRLGIQTTSKHQRCWARQTAMIQDEIEEICRRRRFTLDHMLIIQNPYRRAPLTALLRFDTEVPMTVKVYFWDGQEIFVENTLRTSHQIPILGLYPKKKNEIRIELWNGKDKISHREIRILTNPLPEFLENMIMIKRKTHKSALPLIFVYGGDTKYPYAFDETGNIRYYLSNRPKAYGMFPLSGGKFLFLTNKIYTPGFANPHAVVAYEMDFLGRTHREYYIPDGIHHDGCEMEAGGNLLLASSSMKGAVEDAVIELDRKTGNIVKKLCIKEILQDHPYIDSHDWAHINTVSWLAKDRAVLLCLRNLHSVIKIKWDTMSLEWIFCDPFFWAGTPYDKKVLKPEGNIEYCYQAHASYVISEQVASKKKQLIIYDNHWNKRRPILTFDGKQTSFVRIYEINETEHTIRMQESFECPKSHIRSNAVVEGNSIFAMSGYLTNPIEEKEGMIVEFNRRSKEIINMYMTYNSFYRAYPFWADTEELARNIEISEPFLLGTMKLIQKTDGREESDFSFEHQPRRKRRFQKKKKLSRKRIRKEVRIKQYHQNKKLKIEKEDTRNIIARVRVKCYEDLLMIWGRDHLIQKIMCRSDSQAYVMDYSKTEQRTPSLFAECHYYVTMSLRKLPPDKYHILFQSNEKWYDTGETITKIE